MKRRKVKKMLALEQFNAKQIADGIRFAAEFEMQRLVREAEEREAVKAAALRAEAEAIAIKNEQEILAKLTKPKPVVSTKPKKEETKVDEQA